MARPTTKQDLCTAATQDYEKLQALIANMSEKELNTPFDFSDDPKKTEAHWKRDHNLRDVLIHLHEWHKLLLHWVDENEKGNAVPFIPEPYNWKTYQDMNVGFFEKHQETSLEDAKELFQATHKQVMELAESYTNDQLFSKNVYPWVGGSTLGSYFVSVTASHYAWAMKKLKAHSKKCKA